MSEFPASPETLDPHDFARLVKQAPAGSLRTMMQSETRHAVLNRIFTDMPGVFRADRAGDTDAVVHWCVADRPDGGVDTYELVIANGTCALSPTPRREPKLALTVGAVDFLRLVTGNANPMTLFLTGKLKAKGDLGLTMRIPNLFDPPRP